LRLLLVGYLYGITSERRLMDEVRMHLAYRWFTRLGFDQEIPDHSTFSKNRHGRFRQSGVFREVFEEIVRLCLQAGLVEGRNPLVVVAQNQVLGEVGIQGKTKVDKTSGVWVDGQYVGYVKELTDDKKLFLLPGEHEIATRQAGYIEQVQKVIVEPGKKTMIDINMRKDPKAQFPSGVTSEVKLEATPDRAAVFVDDGYVRTPKEFSGLGRAMVVAPGNRHVRIALAGYQDFTTEINLRPKQKITIKTDLIP
jgi:hypothetical protein